MKTKFLAFFMASALVSGVSLATLYNGAGNGGFGGTISGSQMTWSDDGTSINVSFTKGPGDFNDRFVLYIATGAPGRSSISTEVNDRQDGLRSAISYIEATAGKTLTFATGFEATHAIAIETGFGGLWQIPSVGAVGNDGLNFVTSVNSTLATADQVFSSFSFNVADLGLAPNSGATLRFVGLYLNPFGGDNAHGFVSNEGYGSAFPSENIGQEDFTLTGSLSYTIIPEPGTLLLLLGGLGILAVLRRRSQI